MYEVQVLPASATGLMLVLREWCQTGSTMSRWWASCFVRQRPIVNQVKGEKKLSMSIATESIS
jgi:hypothetical protein